MRHHLHTKKQSRLGSQYNNHLQELVQAQHLAPRHLVRNSISIQTRNHTRCRTHNHTRCIHTTIHLRLRLLVQEQVQGRAQLHLVFHSNTPRGFIVGNATIPATSSKTARHVKIAGKDSVPETPAIPSITISNHNTLDPRHLSLTAVHLYPTHIQGGELVAAGAFSAQLLRFRCVFHQVIRG